jgi:hypothetical protein
MAIYFVSIRHNLKSSLFAPTIWGDRVTADTALEARRIASSLYADSFTADYGGDPIAAVVAKWPPLSECSIVTRKVRV